MGVKYDGAGNDKTLFSSSALTWKFLEVSLPKLSPGKSKGYLYKISGREVLQAALWGSIPSTPVPAAAMIAWGAPDIQRPLLDLQSELGWSY